MNGCDAAAWRNMTVGTFGRRSFSAQNRSYICTSVPHATQVKCSTQRLRTHPLQEYLMFMLSVCRTKPQPEQDENQSGRSSLIRQLAIRLSALPHNKVGHNQQYELPLTYLTSRAC